MAREIRIAVLMVGLVCSVGWAQFAGPAFFSTPPQSQIGPVTNGLVITNTANGFTVTGTATVTTPPAPPTAAGILVEWVIDRPLSPSFVFSNWTTTTNLDGFSAPPIGVVGNTAGNVLSEFTEPGMQPNSQSIIPMTLTNGAATWTTLSNTSPTFSGSTPATPTYYLRQRFFLDGVYQNGPGGNWVIDVPVDSFITQVPEPATAGILSIIAMRLVARRARKR